jgi:hypothetical protein
MKLTGCLQRCKTCEASFYRSLQNLKFLHSQKETYQVYSRIVSFALTDSFLLYTVRPISLKQSKRIIYWRDENKHWELKYGANIVKASAREHVTWYWGRQPVQQEYTVGTDACTYRERGEGEIVVVKTWYCRLHSLYPWQKTANKHYCSCDKVPLLIYWASPNIIWINLIQRTCSVYKITANKHLEFNCGSARGGGIGHYSTTCFKLVMFCYIMTVQNVVYALCTNVYNLSKLLSFIL